MWRAAILLCVATAGCSADGAPDPPPPGEGGCSPPHRLVGERCVEPGVQDDGCPAGTLGLSNGSCQPAGVPPELCAQGFVHDGDAACEPVLPPEPCAKGEMALLGERACHPVMACGSGPWGDIPIDQTTVHVDISYTGGQSDGSMLQPFTTITDAVAAAAPGALIAVATGSYVEDITIDTPVRLFGVCPERVELVGTGATVAALFIEPGANGSEVRGLAVTGNEVGIAVSGALEIRLEHVWVHDTGWRGLNFGSAMGTSSVTLLRSLVEETREVGVMVIGADATLEGVVVRDTLPNVSGELGRGVTIQSSPDSGAGATARIGGSLVERNHDNGVLVIGSEATLEGVVVRDTLPQTSDQESGVGVAIQLEQLSGAVSTALVASSLVERSHDTGILITGAEATLEGVVVRDTLPKATNQEFGSGVRFEGWEASGAASTAHVKSSLIERNHEIGLFVAGASATLEGVVVRDTLPQASDQRYGRGIGVQDVPATGARTTFHLRGALVERNPEFGLFIAASDATLEGVLVRGTLPRASDQLFGRGINILSDAAGAIATAYLTGSRVEQSHEFGVAVTGSEATFEGAVVRDTLARAGDGLFGDGLAVGADTLQGMTWSGRAVVAFSLIEANARAGISSFGSHLSLGDSALMCNTIDLNGETDLGLPHTFENLGRNGCGCPEPLEDCKAQSAGLVPPDASGELH
ncbi:MAG TPA: DUF1565 domain-containing protein [Polyangiaceae bacterium]|nr:DUF1565 domain-containing protein [Polyangiaceae bacterium]